jgi:hypothetical protein
MLLVAHLHFLQTHKAKQKMQKSHQPTHQRHCKQMENEATTDRRPAYNSTYPKGGVSCFV